MKDINYYRRRILADTGVISITFDIEDMEDSTGFIIGGDEVHLSCFENPRLQILALYHEVGHHLLNKENVPVYRCHTKWKVHEEYLAWVLGIQLAKDHKLAFTYTEMKYAVDCITSYYTYGKVAGCCGEVCTIENRGFIKQGESL